MTKQEAIDLAVEVENKAGELFSSSVKLFEHECEAKSAYIDVVDKLTSRIYGVALDARFLALDLKNGAYDVAPKSSDDEENAHATAND